jgi:hypothetical protein
MGRVERRCPVGSTPIVCRHLFRGGRMTGCADWSMQAEEPLAGSALEGIRRWILLECRTAWPARPKLPMLGLDHEAEAALQAGLSIPGTRLQLIRRPRESGALRAFLVDTDAGWVRRSLSSPGGAGWSVPSWKSGAGMERHSEPLLLVCTHGSRDRCCGRLGGELFSLLLGEAPTMVWQSSHLGGHRFAPTALSLPDGLQYGRLNEPSGLASAVSEQRLFRSDCLRGRTGWPKAAQAAASFLFPDDPTLASLVECREEEGVWHVRLSRNGDTQSCTVRRESLGRSIRASCMDGPPKELSRWRVAVL